MVLDKLNALKVPNMEVLKQSTLIKRGLKPGIHYESVGIIIHYKDFTVHFW